MGKIGDGASHELWLDQAQDEKIANELTESAYRSEIVPFVGAGVSILCGQPSWDGFADNTIKQLIACDVINHAQTALFSRLPSARTRLSLAEHLWKAEHKGSVSELWKDAFKRSDNSEHKAAHTKLNQAIWKIAADSKLVVTTNYDKLLREPFEPILLGAADPMHATKLPTVAPTFQRGCDATNDALDRFPRGDTPMLVEWHGATDMPDGMVATTRSYIEHYVKHGSATHLDFLRHLFRKRRVMFVGYGLEELDILEYVFQKAEVNDASSHFLIQGFFAHEKELVDQLRSYYLQEFHVRLLAFNRDRKGYGALVDVLTNIAKRPRLTTADQILKIHKLGTEIP